MDGVRSDIQGLRALAVLMVVVFHLSPTLVPGGYIGVDVFFVISGFLITDHLRREIEVSGTVRLGRFWARRIRRLLPAAFTVIAASAAAVLLVFPRTAWEQNTSELGLAALYVLNWGLAADSVDYLAAENQASIAQHYWSLSVEEQFYLIWPLLILLLAWLARRTHRPQRTTIAVGLGAVLLASLGYGIVATAQTPAAYFMTTTRAWEFAAGAVVALVPQPWHRVKALISWAAIAGLGYACFGYDSATAFPGYAALLPVAATAALLWAGESFRVWTPQFLLEFKPLQHLGTWSYSLYLWHWPVIVTYSTVTERPPDTAAMVGLGLLSVLLAAGTYRFIENPLRRGNGLLGKPWRAYGFGLAGMAVLCGVTFAPSYALQAANQEALDEAIDMATDPNGCFGAFAITNRCPTPYAYSASVNAAASKDDGFQDTGILQDRAQCPGKFVEDRLEVHCDFPSDDPEAPHVVLMGDSHAKHFTDPLYHVAQDLGWHLESRTRSSCSGFLAAEFTAGPSTQRCHTWSQEAYAAVQADTTIDTVIIAIRSQAYRSGRSRPLALQRMEELKRAGKRVIVIASVPGTQDLGQTGPDCVQLRASNDPCTSPVPESDWMISAADSVNVPVVDPKELICSAEVCHVLIGGTLVYSDDSHVTTTFARTMVPWFESKLAPLVSGTPPASPTASPSGSASPTNAP